MTAVLIKSKLLNLMVSSKGGALGRLLPRDRKSLADEAERGRGTQNIVKTVLSRGPVFGPPRSSFAGSYHTSGQAICADSSQSNLNLPRDGPVQCEEQSFLIWGYDVPNKAPR